MATVRDFEELGIFQKARKLSKKIYPITQRREFKYDSRFVQQIRAAAGSISDNIAEGFERQGNKEFKNFLFIAKGSCGEVRSQLNRAFDVGFIDEETYHQMYDECKKLAVSINHFIQTLKDSDYKGTKFS
jgi:four helix bundle protein